MKYYLDITILPDAEANLGFLWHKVYQQIHIALVENKIADNQSAIGLSIPKYTIYERGNKDFPLGNKLRVLAPTEEQLQKLDIEKWLSRLTDYSHVTSIKMVPKSVTKFVYFKRKQVNNNIERLARRRAKRHNESYEKALQYFEGFNEERTGLPFLNINSLSQGNNFKFFIEKQVVEKPQYGDFTCYGFSCSDADKQATVPWF